MSAAWLAPTLIVATTVAGMEVLAALVHRHVMHGIGWGWHQSHHQAGRRRFELNDLYAIVFAALSILLFGLGGAVPAVWWIGVGMVVYGVGYAILHDVLVHRRLPFPRPPRAGYLKRLIQAHRLHHAVREREGAVSFGFLYAPPVERLLQQLRSSRTQG